jgi:hypothetical protein
MHQMIHHLLADDVQVYNRHEGLIKGFLVSNSGGELNVALSKSPYFVEKTMIVYKLNQYYDDVSLNHDQLIINNLDGLQ